MTPEIDFVNIYFTEEKILSVIVSGIGAMATVLALIFLYIIKYSFFKGLAIPLLVIGLIQIAVGGFIFYRTPKDILNVQQIIHHEPFKINTEEVPRIEKVITHLELYEWIELVLMAISIILIIVFYSSPQTFWKGFGLGLLLQACVLFTIDVTAKKRAQLYREKIIRYDNICS